jgi:hypothetical protein
VGHGLSTTHKDVCDIDLARWFIQGCGSLTTCSKVSYLGFCNVIPKIQAINNFFLLLVARSLKNLASLSTHEKEKKAIQE